ncbi:hypothetical protein K461DRAFT_77142 [Myriangium duriaei CBS 260.36]|uniref:Uncharacterized protein n=1 Tax=Myriangium duriaei CBS 260.36 TaxID=1168546 RepID=A0A9P4J9F4_9PEZI|nr:hypothetical protein K461DRAFT_77142 [Myriangium duriaei CBS 260.36]
MAGFMLTVLLYTFPFILISTGGGVESNYHLDRMQWAVRKMWLGSRWFMYPVVLMGGCYVQGKDGWKTATDSCPRLDSKSDIEMSFGCINAVAYFAAHLIIDGILVYIPIVWVLDRLLNEDHTEEVEVPAPAEEPPKTVPLAAVPSALRRRI